jgi:hypothetical protein
MGNEANTQSYCPYCEEAITKVSKDHIFPKFLGGRRKIDSCGTEKESKEKSKGVSLGRA